MGAQTQMAPPGSTGMMLPLTSREALGKLSDLTVPQFAYLCNGNNHSFSLIGLP